MIQRKHQLECKCERIGHLSPATDKIDGPSKQLAKLHPRNDGHERGRNMIWIEWRSLRRFHRRPTSNRTVAIGYLVAIKKNEGNHDTEKALSLRQGEAENGILE